MRGRIPKGCACSTALFGALIVSTTGWIASWYIGPSGRIEVLVVKRDIDYRG